MHVYQMRSLNQSVVSATQHRLNVCMNALRDVSKVWLVAKMVHTLFESILGNKVLEERLQKAAGRRHNKNRTNGVSRARTAQNSPPTEAAMSQPPPQEAPKRKFDDMEFGYTNGPPAPQMSYERSRPVSPAMTPARDLAGQQHHAQHQPQPHQQQQLPSLSTTSPPVRHATDAFLGPSRPQTRPTTPFNGYSFPGTPPDLFLHTRNSPKISEDLWQNYDPGQLFPPEANGMGLGLLSPNEGMVDPLLRHQNDGSMQNPQSGQQGLPTYHQDPQAWNQLQAGLQAQQQQQQQGTLGTGDNDAWSTSSSTGPIVPTTLNVGDWFEFFGIPNGDPNSINGAAHLPGLAGLSNITGGNGSGRAGYG